MFKIGDWVWVKPFSEICNSAEYRETNRTAFVEKMQVFCRSIYEVRDVWNEDSDIYRGYGLKCVDCDKCRMWEDDACVIGWEFSDWMLEKVEEE